MQQWLKEMELWTTAGQGGDYAKVWTKVDRREGGVRCPLQMAPMHFCIVSCVPEQASAIDPETVAQSFDGWPKGF